MTRLTPEMLLDAYTQGVFPMSEGRHDPEIFWVRPEERALIPLDRFHLPRRLARKVRSGYFEPRVDSAFPEVIEACAEKRGERRETWINDEIVALYTALHRMGFVHSVECWRGGVLRGGLYGVAIGGAFFGESMFSRETDASKVALVHLVERLRRGGYRLLDTQFLTPHLATFGAVEVPRKRYEEMLREALAVEGRFYPDDEASPDASIGASGGAADGGSS